MARGRPVVGVALIERLDGPRGQRRQLRILLGTIAGTLTIAQACAELGVGRTRPRLPGPDPDVVALQARVRELEIALRTTALRSEIALTMPYLLDRAGRKKKGAGRRSRP